MPTRQLKVSIKAGDSFRQNLRDGVFSIILEYNMPSTGQPLKLALEPGVELAKFASKDKRISSMAISEGLGREEGVTLLDALPELRKNFRNKEVIAAISGRRLDKKKLDELLSNLADLRASTVVVRTGPAVDDHPRDSKGNPLPAPELYYDSCRMLYRVKRTWPDVHVGAAVNPFKYVLADTHLQYYKMLKKIATGTDFLVSQPGWDMKKLHELQWYQKHRGLDEPVVARLMLLRRSIVSRIMDHDLPGVTISRELGTQVQRAADEGAAGAEVQVRRLALQIAGCRLLGYSGVELCGIHNVTTAKAVLDQAFAAFDDFADFDAWLAGWNEFTKGVQMAPIPKAYYAFTNLLEEGGLDYDPETSTLNSEMMDPPSSKEQRAYNLAAKLELEKRSGAIKGALRHWICGCRGDQEWHLNRTMLVSAADCPKGLEEGPCGESRPNGLCEFGTCPCFYHRVLRLAQWQRKIDLLEDPFIDE